MIVCEHVYVKIPQNTHIHTNTKEALEAHYDSVMGLFQAKTPQLNTSSSCLSKQKYLTAVLQTGFDLSNGKHT